MAVIDIIPNVLWTHYFLAGQGFGAKAIVKQDNKSAILLENNGKASSGKKTKHIDVRYFFVKDRVESGEVSIEHCPTEEMIADFFTKPLQGSLFLKMRTLIMGLPLPDEARAKIVKRKSAPYTATPARSTGVCWNKCVKDNEKKAKPILGRVSRIARRASILRTSGARYQAPRSRQ